MYRQFCRNYDNYMNINKGAGYRYKIGEDIKALTDIALFIEMKKNRTANYLKTLQLICEMKKIEPKNPAIKRFLWELWAYGFDIEGLSVEESISREENVDADVDEKIKLIKLLLGTQYWK